MCMKEYAFSFTLWKTEKKLDDTQLFICFVISILDDTQNNHCCVLNLTILNAVGR